MSASGSSPRVRGKLQARRVEGVASRIIPARAGQTLWLRPATWLFPDHPRACGANVDGFPSKDANAGSSPRVRGKRPRRGILGRGQRIIPARAGQTPGPDENIKQLPDHPRACGANPPMMLRSCVGHGSSPRVRGKLRLQHSPKIRLRIIPARAGQTWVPMLPASDNPDHPRACGANFSQDAAGWARAGSSPRVRGKLPQQIHVGHGVRIIPARAGQTGRQGGRGRRDAGSSPRVRGKPQIGFRFAAGRRIIPARAGQTPRWFHRPLSCPDHPRACGANACTCCQPAFRLGSSPRVRGKQ